MYIIKLKRIFVLFAAVVTASVIAVIAHTAVQTSAPDTQTVRVPILMYHSILKHSTGSKYIVSPDAFESDLKYLNEHGYTTIFIQDLINYVYDNAELPEKPVILTFDDGYYNNYVYIYPLLQQYRAKAVISVVGSYADLYTETPDTHANYAHLSWDTIRELNNSGLVEIQNHSYDLHSLDKGRKGCGKNYGESTAEYTALLKRDIGGLQEKFAEQLGSAPAAFTYPFGTVSEESFDVIKELGFKASLSCQEGINELERDPEQLYMLKRCIRTPQRDAADILTQ